MQKTQVPSLGLRRSPEGNGYPLQYSCLKNPMDRGAWWLQSMGSQRVRHDWVTNTFCVALDFPIPTILVAQHLLSTLYVFGEIPILWLYRSPRLGSCFFPSPSQPVMHFDPSKIGSVSQKYIKKNKCIKEHKGALVTQDYMLSTGSAWTVILNILFHNTVQVPRMFSLLALKSLNKRQQYLNLTKVCGEWPLPVLQTDTSSEDSKNLSTGNTYVRERTN